MRRRLVGPQAISANAMAQEVGVPQKSLSQRLRATRNVEGMAPSWNPKKKWTGAEKLRIVIEARGLCETDLGAILRPRRPSSAAFRTSSASYAGRMGHWRRRRPSWCKKGPGDLGGRGRRHAPETRVMICALIDAAVLAGARRAPACRVVGLSGRTVERWRAGADMDARHGPHHVPMP